MELAPDQYIVVYSTLTALESMYTNMHTAGKHWEVVTGHSCNSENYR